MSSLTPAEQTLSVVLRFSFYVLPQATKGLAFGAAQGLRWCEHPAIPDTSLLPSSDQTGWSGLASHHQTGCLAMSSRLDVKSLCLVVPEDTRVARFLGVDDPNDQNFILHLLGFETLWDLIIKLLVVVENDFSVLGEVVTH
ncbi:hypothetical protein [Shimia gijangensis]|uniref:hypothetical protein n=1 Tax=Shimia gijangensis TaxID=1470563 RepID=UPI001114DF9C|nr:hypothetical protein [Shimia gijangensis]